MTNQIFIESLRAELAAVADPQRAPQMQSYMKSELPFYGVAMAQTRRLVRQLDRLYPCETRQAWTSTIVTLFDTARYREEKYAALELADLRSYAAYRDGQNLDLWRHLIVTGAWWDIVDNVASALVGQALRADSQVVRPVMVAWASDADMWLRRTAIICQLGSKADTDLELLQHAIDANVEGTRYGSEFFIRKAIGWALRQYARQDAEWVRTFVAERRHQLSGLSQREALKHC